MKIIWNSIKRNYNKLVYNNTNCNCVKTTSITGSYYIRRDDHYISVAATKPSTVYLPINVSDGKIIIVKSEMTPPMCGRYITITTVDGSKIDGYTDATITVSHDCKSFIFQNANWHIIS